MDLPAKRRRYNVFAVSASTGFLSALAGVD
jgi:hypothetical protein